EMPGMDGAALVKALRQTKVGRQLYIMMITGHGEDEAQVQAFEAGADDYVVKPFRPRLLAARLRACTRVIRLQEEVQRDEEALRQSDVVWRLGGEEFVMIAPGLDRDRAVACAERLRVGVEKQIIEVGKGAVRVTLSVGVAVRGESTGSPAELLKAADLAVYAA